MSLELELVGPPIGVIRRLEGMNKCRREVTRHERLKGARFLPFLVFSCDVIDIEDGVSVGVRYLGLAR